MSVIKKPKLSDSQNSKNELTSSVNLELNKNILR